MNNGTRKTPIVPAKAFLLVLQALRNGHSLIIVRAFFTDMMNTRLDPEKTIVTCHYCDASEVFIEDQLLQERSCMTQVNGV